MATWAGELHAVSTTNLVFEGGAVKRNKKNKKKKKQEKKIKKKKTKKPPPPPQQGPFDLIIVSGAGGTKKKKGLKKDIGRVKKHAPWGDGVFGQGKSKRSERFGLGWDLQEVGYRGQQPCRSRTTGKRRRNRNRHNERCVKKTTLEKKIRSLDNSRHCRTDGGTGTWWGGVTYPHPPGKDKS